MGLVGDVDAGGAVREGRAASRREEEYESIARSYHDTALSGKLRQAIHQATNRDGVGCLLQDDQCTKTGQLVAEVLWEKHLDRRFPPMENPMCTAFEGHEDAPKTVPLDFAEDDVTWVSSNISGTTGALAEKAIDLRDFIICFEYVLEELRVVFVRLADCMFNSSLPWSAYRALMACRLVALDKSPGVRPVRIREMLHRALDKLVIRESGDQAKRECGKFQLCSAQAPRLA